MRALACLRNDRGFTLVELMLSLLLMSTIFLAVCGLFGRSVAFWRQAEFKVDMYDSMRISFDLMGRELMYARQPDSTYPDSGYPGGVLVYSDKDHLYFEIDDTPTVDVPNPPPLKIHYYCLNNNLYRQENSASAQPLASNIQKVEFIYYDRTGAEVYPTSIATAETVRQVKIILTGQDSMVSPTVMVQKVSLRSL